MFLQAACVQDDKRKATAQAKALLLASTVSTQWAPIILVAGNWRRKWTAQKNDRPTAGLTGHSVRKVLKRKGVVWQSACRQDDKRNSKALVKAPLVFWEAAKWFMPKPFQVRDARVEDLEKFAANMEDWLDTEVWTQKHYSNTLTGRKERKNGKAWRRQLSSRRPVKNCD